MKLPRIILKHGRWYTFQATGERYPSKKGKLGKLKRKWVGLSREKAGQNALMRALADLHVERHSDLQERITEFLKTKKPELTAGVYLEHERIFRVIGEAFQDFNVAQIRPGDVLQFLDQFAEHPSMRKAYQLRLSTFFRWCVIHDYREANPCREIRLKAPPPRARKITATSFHAIRDALPPIGKVFLDLSFLTCQRPTDIRLLKESQTTTTGLCFRPSKTASSSGTEVTWPITPEIQEVLTRARKLNKLQALSGDCYVVQNKDGSAYTPRSLGDLWRRACKKAGVQSITTRDIRPYAMNYAKIVLKASMEDLKQAAAHKAIKTTEIYMDRNAEVISPIRMKLPERKR